MILSSVEEVVAPTLENSFIPALNMFLLAINKPFAIYGFSFSIGDIIAFSLLGSLTVYLFRRLIDIV